MIKFLLLILITIIFFGCSSPLKKDLDKLMGNRIEDSIEKVSNDISLPELVITQKMMYFLFPLFFCLFIGTFLFVSGPRTIGIAVLIASIVCIILIVTMVVYIKLIAIIGVGVLLVGTYFIGKDTYDKIITQRDLVNSVEIVKKLVPSEKMETLSKDLDIAQSTYTKKIVKEIRSK